MNKKAIYSRVIDTVQDSISGIEFAYRGTSRKKAFENAVKGEESENE
jgi:hypothetical protein